MTRRIWCQGRTAAAVVAVALALTVGSPMAGAGTQAGAAQAAVAPLPSGQVPFTDAVPQEDVQFDGALLVSSLRG